MNLLQYLLQNLENVLIVVFHLYLNSPRVDALSESALGSSVCGRLAHSLRSGSFCSLWRAMDSRGGSFCPGPRSDALATLCDSRHRQKLLCSAQTRAGRVPGFPGGFPLTKSAKGRGLLSSGQRMGSGRTPSLPWGLLTGRAQELPSTLGDSSTYGLNRAP